jgi:hypothetical protein
MTKQDPRSLSSLCEFSLLGLACFLIHCTTQRRACTVLYIHRMFTGQLLGVETPIYLPAPSSTDIEVLYGILYPCVLVFLISVSSAVRCILNLMMGLPLVVDNADCISILRTSLGSAPRSMHPFLSPIPSIRISKVFPRRSGPLLAPLARSLPSAPVEALPARPHWWFSSFFPDKISLASEAPVFHCQL